MDDNIGETNSRVGYTVAIVTAYLSNNAVATEEVPRLIEAVHRTLAGLGGGEAPSMPDALQPAVPVAESVTPDYLVCLEDGKRLKMLKRHLMTAFNMTPDEYRSRWKLPADYPMVAPNYAMERSRLAKQIGLGNNGRGAQTSAAAGPQAAMAPARRSRAKA